MQQQNIKNIITQSIATKTRLLQDSTLLDTIEKAANLLIQTFQNDGKVLFCGNGGSAAELSGRFLMERPPLFAEALHVNSSFMTAVANDYDFETVYARALEACGRKGDCLVAISTSGNSPNILRAIDKAKELNINIIGLTGESGGKMADLCDLLINVPSQHTPRVQEAHIMVGHILCELVEKGIFS
jgi:D-sedoheptulose 7-phosphate isomerase